MHRNGLLGWVLLCSFSLLAQNRPLILATTTSTQDSGLLDQLIPLFEKKTGTHVKTIAVGSGQAMAMGRKGEADVLLVHSPEAELSFMAEGKGVDRRKVMHNDFILLGPETDPAQVKAAKKAIEAFRCIARGKALFLSRGDESGTHTLEKKIWNSAGIEAEGQTWYQQTGLGMGQTLSIATEKKAYTLSDRSTFLAMKKHLSLVILHEGDPSLLNVYHVIGINPAKYKNINAQGAKAFGDFLVSKEAQDLIANFGVEKFGSPLFFKNAEK